MASYLRSGNKHGCGVYEQYKDERHAHLALLSRHRYSRGSAALALVVFTPLSMNSPAWGGESVTAALRTVHRIEKHVC